MAEEGRGVALAILGIVAVIAVVGLVLLFTGATGRFVQPTAAKLYTRQSILEKQGAYPDYVWETYGGETEQRVAVGDRTAGGGNWGAVYGEADWQAARESGENAGPDIPGAQAPTYKRAPSHITSDDNSPCGFCPEGSTCQVDPRRVPETWEPVAGYPGCYVVGPTY